MYALLGRGTQHADLSGTGPCGRSQGAQVLRDTHWVRKFEALITQHCCGRWIGCDWVINAADWLVLTGALQLEILWQRNGRKSVQHLRRGELWHRKRSRQVHTNPTRTCAAG